MSQAPNILFLFSDEHSFRCMGHRGMENGGENISTPTFDWLAQHGTVFSEAYCAMPLCTPSRLCMLSGKQATNAGAWTNDSVFRKENISLPTTMAKHGYTTCLVGKMHLGGNLQYVGFQHRPYGDLLGNCGHQWEPLDGPHRHGMRARTNEGGVTEIPESMIQDQVVCHEALSFIRDHDATSKQPWFVTCSFSRPHFPHRSPKRHISRYNAENVGQPKVPAGGDAYDHPMSANMRKGFWADQISHEENMKARTEYFANISYLDEILDDFFVRLEREGSLDNTIIIYSTDHGEMMGEHGVWWKNGWYEGCTHIPMIISTPEQRKGTAPARVVNTPVNLIDIYPTICSLCNIPAPEDLEGRSLSKALQGEALEDIPVFTDALEPRWGEGSEFRSIRFKDFKYVNFRNLPPLMFDLQHDPGEQKNMLLYPMSPEQTEIKAYLETIAKQSIDFDTAEIQRKKDKLLHQEFPKVTKEAYLNLYVLSSGKILAADHHIYEPSLLVPHARMAFSDHPDNLPTV